MSNRSNRRHRHLLFTAVAAGSLLATSACGSSSKSSSAGGSTAGSNSTKAASSSASNSAPGLKGKTITIGLNLPLSGAVSEVGVGVEEGARAFADSANAAAGSSGYRYSIVADDDAYSLAQSSSVARTLSSSSFAIIAAGTPPFQGSLPVSNQTGLPMFVGADGALFSPAPKNAFDVAPPYGIEGDGDARYIMSHLSKDFALAYQDDALGQPIGAAVPKYVASNGGKLLADVPVSDSATDYSSYATKLKESGAKVVYMFSTATPFAGLQKAAATIGYNPIWVGNGGLQDPSYFALAGPLAHGTYTSGYESPPIGNGPGIAAYDAAMKKYEPSTNPVNAYALQGWDFMQLINVGVQRATTGGAALTRAGFVTAVSGFKDLAVGALGPITYTPQSHAGVTQTAMWKIEDNDTIIQVSPYTALPS